MASSGIDGATDGSYAVGVSCSFVDAVNGNGGHFFKTQTGNTFTFEVDGAEAVNAGAEAVSPFVITATDHLGNATTANGTRTFDDKAPVLSGLTIARADVASPPAGVTYPAAITGSGWTGSRFIYNDSVRVRGTLTDLGGLGATNLAAGLAFTNDAVSFTLTDPFIAGQPKVFYRMKATQQ